MAHFWLSFCDDNAPSGSQFLGVTVVEAGSPVEAVAAAWALGANPGGSVAMMELPGAVRPEYVGRLFAGDAGRALAALTETELFSDG